MVGYVCLCSSAKRQGMFNIVQMGDKRYKNWFEGDLYICRMQTDNQHYIKCSI